MATNSSNARSADRRLEPLILSAEHFVTPHTLATVLERLLTHLPMPKTEADKLRRQLETLTQHHSRPLAAGDRLLRMGDLRKKFGVASNKLLKRCLGDPTFPVPVSLPSCEEGRDPQRRWRESDVDAWLSQRPEHALGNVCNND